MNEERVMQGATIMIVDDNPANLKVLYQTLEKGGFTDIIPAQSKASALLRLQYVNPDLILLDIRLPDGDGFDLYHDIRERPATAETPIIFVSAVAERASIERGFALGAVDYISKPFQTAEVLGRVRTHLRLRTLQKWLMETNDQLAGLMRDSKGVLDSAAEGIIGINPDASVRFMNPYAMQLLGYGMDECLGKDFHRLVHHQRPDGSIHDGQDCAILRVARQGGAETVPMDQFIAKDGRPVLVEYTVSNPRDGKKREMAIVVFRDISERRRIEQRMEEAGILFEVSNDGVMITDQQGTILRVNPAFSEITGYSVEDAVGRNPRLLKSGHHSGEHYERMWEEISKKGYWEGETWNRRKDGSIYPEWQRITVFYDEFGRVRGYLSQFSDITRRKLTEEEIRFRGNYDSLTGLANRSLLLERLEQAIKLHLRSKRHLSLLFIDLDRFKPVNDSLGHIKGDQLLQQVALRIKQTIREMDTAARLGGDEFVVMMIDQDDPLSSERVASQLVDCLGQPFDLDGIEVKIGASVGIAVFPQDGEAQETLFRNADIAMYKAKERGRNQFQFFTDTMEREYRERFQLENDLRLALERGQLLLHYQPIVDTASGHPVGVEALLRWQHPQRGMVPPQEFIPLAEEIGIVRQIGAWVFETVCQQLQRWRGQGLDLYVAINISTHQIPTGLPVDWLQSVVDGLGLPARCIVLEITESVFARDMDEVAHWLEEVRGRGFRIYLDDFGTGYSSLSYLQRFQVDAVKIDRSFIRDLKDDHRDQAMVRAVASMSKALDLKVVAEGIETEEQLRLLRDLDCHYSQGYLFSRPMPADLLEDALKALAGKGG